MYIEEGNIIGYTWEVWYGGSCLHEDDEVFDTENEAEDAAKEFCKDRMEQWKLDGGYYGETLDDFNIVINDVIGEENYDDEE